MDSRAATVLLLNSGRSMGRGGRYTKSFTYSHRKKSNGVGSRDRGVHRSKPCNSDLHVLSIVGEQHRSTNLANYEENESLSLFSAEDFATGRFTIWTAVYSPCRLISLF